MRSENTVRPTDRPTDRPAVLCAQQLQLATPTRHSPAEPAARSRSTQAGRSQGRCFREGKKKSLLITPAAKPIEHARTRVRCHFNALSAMLRPLFLEEIPDARFFLLLAFFPLVFRSCVSFVPLFPWRWLVSQAHPSPPRTAVCCRRRLRQVAVTPFWFRLEPNLAAGPRTSPAHLAWPAAAQMGEAPAGNPSNVGSGRLNVCS